MKYRGIDEKFINDLNSGELAFFLQRVKENPKLALCIRGGYINIYYRGGNLLKISKKGHGYLFKFDEKYCLNEKDAERIKELDGNSTKDYESNFERLICEMDTYFSKHPKDEREYQHNVLINNPSVIDVEYQIGKKRFDMLMVQDGKLIIVENKYGTGAINGKDGLAYHYCDICETIKDENKLSEIKESVKRISKNKFELGITDKEYTSEKIDAAETEILFLVADFNQKSGAINKEVELMNKMNKMNNNSINTKLLFMEKDNYRIDYSEAKDLFTYGN